MKWASAISENPVLELAMTETTERVHAELAGVDAHLVLVFVSPHHQAAYPDALGIIARRFPGAEVLGCSGGGIIGGGHEVESSPAVSLTAAHLPGVSLSSFHLERDRIPAPDASDDEWRALVGVAPGSDASFILLPDPFSFEVGPFVRGVDARYPGAAKIGGLASGGRHLGENVLFSKQTLHRSGMVGLALAGDVVVETIVAQGCRPVGAPMLVTRSEHNLIFELGSKPALAVLRELFDSLDARDRELAQHSLFIGIEMKDQREYHAGDFLIRNLVGVDPKRSALAVGAVLKPWQVVQFHLRDAETSHEDLQQRLARLPDAEPAPSGALVFSCMGRGEYLYGQPDHDSGLFRARFGEVPLGGFFCGGEIGPVGGTTFVHGYTSAFGLFRRRSRE